MLGLIHVGWHLMLETASTRERGSVAPHSCHVGVGGGANTLKDDGLKTSTSSSRKGPKIVVSLLTAGLHILETGGP